jgi:hypothetical protein
MLPFQLLILYSEIVVSNELDTMGVACGLSVPAVTFACKDWVTVQTPQNFYPKFDLVTSNMKQIVLFTHIVWIQLRKLLLITDGSEETLTKTLQFHCHVQTTCNGSVTVCPMDGFCARHYLKFGLHWILLLHRMFIKCIAKDKFHICPNAVNILPCFYLQKT